jgi:hypothetical protein
MLNSQIPSDSRKLPDAPDDAAYHGLSGEFVKMVAPHTEADSIALLVQFLVAFGSVAGRSVRKFVESTPHFLNMFAVLVGTTSKSRKGTAWSRVLRFFESVDGDWSDRCVKSGLSSGEGLIWTVRDGSEGDGISDKRLLIVEPEFASVLRVAQRKENILSTILRQAWDTGKLRTLTKNAPAGATGAHVSVIGHITNEELTRELTRIEIGNGFANRFLFVFVRRSRCLPFGGSLRDEDLQPLVERAKLAVEFAKHVREITFDADAAKLWETSYGGLSEGRPGLLGAVLARGEAHSLRLACLYATLDSSASIRVEHLRGALALWEYCERSACFIFGERSGDHIADQIHNVLLNAPNGLTRTEINNLFSGNVNAESLHNALQLLSARGLASAQKESGSGRPAERWRVNTATAGEETARDGAGAAS